MECKQGSSFHRSDVVSSSDSPNSNNNSSSSGLSFTSAEVPPSPKVRKLRSSKYKGVVPQPNGRWGAQLYDGHLRVWLGTFDHQEQAARAYDIAAISFRGPHAVSNLAIHHYGRSHLEFLSSISRSQVVDLLRAHTYGDELARYTTRVRARRAGSPSTDPTRLEMLFQKVLTRSDVGKLHRLVIPRCHAQQHLPSFSDVDEGMMLSFEDVRGDKVWRFKYRYWSSSHNYVLTKGWPQFIKEKGLRAGDVVTFYSSSSVSPHHKQQFHIETYSNSSRLGHDEIHGVGFGKSNNVLRLFGVDICPMIPC